MRVFRLRLDSAVQRKATWTTFALLVFPIMVWGQARDYGTIVPKNPLSKAAGIGQIQLSTYGDTTVLDGFEARAEVMSEGGSPLATCQMRWPEGEELVARCDFVAGDSFEVSGVLVPLTGRVKNLTTGERVDISWEAGEPAADEPSADRDPRLDALRGRFAYDGDKTKEEMEEEWGESLRSISALIVEVQTLVFGDQGPSHRRGSDPRAPAEEQGAALEQQPVVGDHPDGVVICPTGDSPACNGGPTTGAATAFTRPDCCANANTEVQGDCQSASGLSCCTVTSCLAFCGLNGSVLCTCARSAYWWRCPSTCGLFHHQTKS